MRRSQPPVGQRGAVIPIVALMMVILLVTAAFAVDLGMQRVVRRDMQAISDVVALDAARLIDGRTRQQIEAGAAAPGKRSLSAVVAASTARNASTSVGETPAVSVYLVQATADGTYPVGADGLPMQVAETAVPNAVVARAASKVNFAFGAITGSSGGAASRSSVARTTKPMVCFSVGTRTLALDTNSGALSPILKHILGVNLGAVGYDGLVNAKAIEVPLVGLMTNLGVGTTDQLAAANVGLGPLTVAMVNAVRANSPTVDVAALNSLLGLDLAIHKLNLGKILKLATGTPIAGLTGTVNALDLVTAAIVAANGTRALAANVLIPGLVGVTLTITEPPQIACGSPTDTPAPTARSAQIRLRVAVPLDVTNSAGLTGGGVDLRLQVGAGEATLKALSCAPESATFDVATGAVTVPSDGESLISLKLTLGRFLGVLGPLGDGLELLLWFVGLSEIGIQADVGVAVASQTVLGQTITYPTAPLMPPTTEVHGSDGAVLDVTAANVEIQSTGIIGWLSGGLNAATGVLLGGVVQPLVNTVVSPLLSLLLNPLFKLLGIELGTTEVDMVSRPQCSGVSLVG